MDVDTPDPPRFNGSVPYNYGGIDDDNDSDPIIASYTVLSNPPLPSTRKILMLQYPNKQGNQRDQAPRQITQVRIKPNSGMVEVDVPVSYHTSDYDRDKGMRWGQALVRSMGAKGGGSHGLAGGFGVGVPAPRRRVQGDGDIYDWNEAVRRDQVLRTQTLGGMYNAKAGENEGTCRWMIGVFQASQLHLTPATNEIQLRPQLHHLDAATEQDRTRMTGAGSLLAGGKDGAGPSSSGPAAAPKAIHMTIKNPSSSDETTTETMADRLRHVQTESWTKLKYVNEDHEDAWDLFYKTLLYEGNVPEIKDAKGEAKDAIELKTNWTEHDYLRAVVGSGSTALPGIKAEDVIEDVKEEDTNMSMTEAVRKASASASKAKAGSSTAKKPAAASKGKTVRFG